MEKTSMNKMENNKERQGKLPAVIKAKGSNLWQKQRGLFLLLAIELVLLLLLLPGLWEKQTLYNVPQESIAGVVTETAKILLPEQKPGVYEITVEYGAAEESSSAISVFNDNNIYKSTCGNDILLPGSSTTKTMTVWLTAGSENVYVQISPGENANLTIHKLQLTSTNAGAVVAIVCLLLVSLLLNGYCVYGYFVQGKADARERKQTALGLVGIFMVAALPIFTDYCLNGNELHFHLLRIEGLTEGLLNGQFPVRIQPNWLNGQGYAVSVFEGDTFLLIPALLRMAGFPVQTAYKIYLLCVNGATVGIAYGCFRGMFGRRSIGLLASMMYVWMPYRLDALYGNADLGEATALCFLPMVFCGFYRILTVDKDSKRYGQVWILPAVGLSCMFQSHVTSFVLALGMAGVLCIGAMVSKRSLKTGILAILAISKTALAVLVLNAWMLVPLLDSLLNGNLLIKYTGALPIQSKGGSLQHYLTMFFRNGNSRDFEAKRLLDTAPLGMGFVLSGLLLVYVWILFTGKYKEQRKDNVKWRFGLLSAWTGGVLMIMSMGVFPWDALRGRVRVLQLLTTGLKTPMELVPMVSICFIFTACVVMEQIRKKENAVVTAWVFGAVVAVAFVTTQFLTGDMIRNREAVRIYDGAALDTTQILGGEYLPMGADIGTGYSVPDDSGERNALQELLAGELNPEWYWRVSEVISVGGLFGLCGYQIIFSRKNRGSEDGYVEKI